MKNYIFGYGSLIENESRTRTTKNAIKVYPAYVVGYKRGWFARVNVPGLTTTFLGCIKSESLNNKVNGVIYEIHKNDLPDLDRRENNYTRVEIRHSDIKLLANLNLNLNDKVFVYLNEGISDDNMLQYLPNKDFPIVQSYVDICINGCIEIEETYPQAKEVGYIEMFISETYYWSEYWANDRIYPRRPFIYRPNAYTIDAHLKRYLKDSTLFDKIYIE